MKNINDFDTGVALIMGMLYENFPIPIDIKTSEIPELNIKEDDSDIREKGERWSELSRIYYYSAIFLLEEGYIRGERVKGYIVLNNCCLTSKGLAALQQIPEFMKSKKAIGEWFSQLGKESVKDITIDGIKAAVSMALHGS